MMQLPLLPTGHFYPQSQEKGESNNSIAGVLAFSYQAQEHK
jgi:hypothetical protein